MAASTSSLSSVKANCGSIVEGNLGEPCQQTYHGPSSVSTGLSAIRQAQAAGASSEQIRRYRLRKGFESPAGAWPYTGGAGAREEEARRAIQESKRRFRQGSQLQRRGMSK